MSSFTRFLLLFAALFLAAFGVFSAQQGETGSALGSFGLMLLLGWVALVGWFSHRFTLPKEKQSRNIWRYLRMLEAAYPNQPLWVVKYILAGLAVIVLLIKVYQA